MWLNLGVVLTAVFFGVIGFYLTLIAKFYRLKFQRGPSAGWMQTFLVILLLGLLLKMHALEFLPMWLSAVLRCTGGIGFSVLAYLLYRAMMAV